MANWILFLLLLKELKSLKAIMVTWWGMERVIEEKRLKKKKRRKQIAFYDYQELRFQIIS